MKLNVENKRCCASQQFHPFEFLVDLIAQSVDRQFRFCTQVIIGGITHSHSTHLLLSVTLSPTIRSWSPNLHFRFGSAAVRVSEGMGLSSDLAVETGRSKLLSPGPTSSPDRYPPRTGTYDTCDRWDSRSALRSKWARSPCEDRSGTRCQWRSPPPRMLDSW